MHSTTVNAWLGALFVAFGRHGVWSDPSLEQTARDETLAVAEHISGMAEGLIEFLDSLEPPGAGGEQLAEPLPREDLSTDGYPDTAARAVETMIRSAARTTRSIARVIAAIPPDASLPGRLAITGTLLWVCEVDHLLEEARDYADGTVNDAFTAEDNAPSFTAREETERLGVWTRAFISTIHFSKELRGEQLGGLAVRAAAA